MRDKTLCEGCPGKGPAYPNKPNPILQYFKYKHLPPKLQDVSKPFWFLAAEMESNLPNGPEKSAGLRKLLEAKDCMVRAAL